LPFPAVWNLLGWNYYEFVVVKEPELTVLWREYHRQTERRNLPDVYQSKKDPEGAFHVLKSHVPYKEGRKSIIFFGHKNALNRTGLHQYYPLEDYDTLIAVQHPEEAQFIPELDDNGQQKYGDDGKPLGEVYTPVRHVSLTTSWLKDFNESRADHKVQAEPPPGGLAALLPYLLPLAVIGLVIYIVSVISGHPILGK
jgi:hypothetical protein